MSSIFNRIVDLIKNPITEMVVAAIIDLSRNYLFIVMNQFIGDPLPYLIFQVSIVVVPWIMLGHGALRYPEKTNNAHFNIHSDSFSSVIGHKNLNLFNLVVVSSLVIKFLSI